MMKTIDDGPTWTLGGENFVGRELKASANGLNGLMDFIERHPDSALVIEGHTDSLGNENHNRVQSQAQAEAVMAYLIEKGIASSRLTAVGRGCWHPVAGNHTAAGRRQNARVEVKVRSADA